MPRPYGPPIGSDLGPQHPRNRVVHQLRHLLPGADCLDLERPHRPLTHPLDERARHLEAHIRLEQVAADLAQRVGHIRLGQHAPAPKPLQAPGAGPPGPPGPPDPPTDRLLAQARSNPLANRAAAAELSQTEYHTSASNPGPSTRNRSPPQPLASQAACSSVLSSSSSANSSRVSNSPRSSS